MPSARHCDAAEPCVRFLALPGAWRYLNLRGSLDVGIAAPNLRPRSGKADPATWDHNSRSGAPGYAAPTHLPVFRSLEADAAPRAARAHRAPEFPAIHAANGAASA